MQDFLDSEPPLENIEKYIKEVQDMKTELAALRSTIPMQLFLLDTTNVRESLMQRCQAIIAALVKHVMAGNRRSNRSICERFDSIANTLMAKPATSKEMVELNEFLQTVKAETIYQLKDAIKQMTGRMRFLLDYGVSSPEDVKLNTTTWQWPDRLQPMFEVTQRRIDEHKLAAVNALKHRIEEFERKLENLWAKAILFQSNSDGIRKEEVSHNIRVLDQLADKLSRAKEEVWPPFLH